MSQLTGKSEEDIINELNGVIFLDPVYGDWQTADEYLSGNVRKKLREALSGDPIQTKVGQGYRLMEDSEP